MLLLASLVVEGTAGNTGIGLVLVFALYPLFRDIDSHPNRLYLLFGAMAVLGAAYLLFAELWPFPADVDAANLASGRKNAYTLLGAVLGMTFAYWLDRRYVHFDVRAVWWATSPLPSSWPTT